MVTPDNNKLMQLPAIYIQPRLFLWCSVICSLKIKTSFRANGTVTKRWIIILLPITWFYFRFIRHIFFFIHIICVIEIWNEKTCHRHVLVLNNQWAIEWHFGISSFSFHRYSLFIGRRSYHRRIHLWFWHKSDSKNISHKHQ